MLTKIVKSKFFYYLLIYKAVGLVLKFILIIYFWDHYFGKNKKKQTPENN